MHGDPNKSTREGMQMQWSKDGCLSYYVSSNGPEDVISITNGITYMHHAHRMPLWNELHNISVTCEILVAGNLYSVIIIYLTFVKTSAFTSREGMGQQWRSRDAEAGKDGKKRGERRNGRQSFDISL